MTYEHDSELARWGLRLLEGDEEDRNKYIGCSVSSFESGGGPISSSEYNSDISHYRVLIQHDPYSRGNYQTESSNVQNDEIIAQTLQEELSQLDVTEESEFHESQQNSESVYQQDWHNPSLGEYYTGQEHGWEDGNAELVPSSTFPSTHENFHDGEEYPYSLELMDESELDGEVGKRLNQMIPVPHVPKVNGEIPSLDDATSDYERLVHRLKVYNLVELKVQGDGNCQFRALSDQFYRTPEHHKFVRRQVVKQLQSHPEVYQEYVPMTFGEYLKKISKSGEWGDHVTLQSAADSYGVRIVVITSFKDTCYIEILPEVQKSNRVIYLSFWAEVHYNSIYPQGDSDSDMHSVNEFKKKRRWWSLGSKN
uniref:ubiquitinyl hydrolase 1 n=1 Tax=Kalanchoe fedtschenkoi TaxID=63787 RepID=A0A7N0R9K0_KALFE